MRERRRERDGERGGQRWRRGERGDGEKHYPQMVAKKQQGSPKQCANSSATWLGNMVIGHVIYHNLLVVNFSFGKETAGLELPKS